ncbi:uncharacterized protein LOC144098066 [Amblyomma americanum]
MHTSWGYHRSDARGRHLWQHIVKDKLTIVNDLTLPSRCGQQKGQQDTSPDLTLVSHPNQIIWSRADDVMGTDHYPVVVSWAPRGRKSLKRHQRHRIEEHVSWDDFRRMLGEVNVPTELDELITQINGAKKKATTKLLVKYDAPKPDSHLLSLWNRRLRALKAYRRSGRTSHRRRALTRITQEVEQYTMQLALQDWQLLCHSLNGTVNLSKAWHIFRAVLGRKRPIPLSQGMALKLNVSPADLAIQAGKVFFPQPEKVDALPADPVSDTSNDYDVPFTLEELEAALYDSNHKSAPGPDGVRYSTLLNLPKSHKLALLKVFNECWTNGALPPAWKESVVIPIPKPGIKRHLSLGCQNTTKLQCALRIANLSECQNMSLSPTCKYKNSSLAPLHCLRM